MSGKTKRGGKYYLTYKIRQPNPNFDPTVPAHYKTNPKHLWRAKEVPVSPDRDTFDEFQDNFDYDRRRRGLGLHNDRKTWADFLFDFEKHRLAKRRSSARRDKTAMDHWNRLIKHIERPLEVSHQEVQHYFEKRKGEGAAAGTLRAEYNCLRAAFNMAVKWKYLTENPFNAYPQPKVSDRPDRYLSPRPRADGTTEEARLLAAARARLEADWVFALLFLDAGLRLEEACHALRGWVNLERNAICVTPWEGEDWSTKNYLAREIPLTRRLRRALEAVLGRHGRPEEPLVPGPNGIWHWRTIEKHFTAIFKAAGIEDATIHMLRHDFCTRMHRKGVRMRTIQKWMGHQNIKTTEGYCHVDDEEGQEQMRRADQEMPE
jgi:integrase